LEQSALHKTGNISVTPDSIAYDSAQMPRKSVVMLFILACMSILFVTLATGCGESGYAQAREIVQATPTPIRPQAPTPTPAATAVPAISPDRLSAASTLVVKLGCAGCHTIAGVPEAQGIIGPNLSHIYADAAKIIVSPEYKSSKGQATTARDYLKESIFTPSAFVYPNCPIGDCTDFVMPRDFKTRLSTEDVNLILDFLSTLN
jgi:hypothetical protein